MDLLGSDEPVLDTHVGSPSPTVAASVHNVAAPIRHFVPSEVRTVDTLCRVHSLAAPGHWSPIAVVRMKVVIYVAPEIVRYSKPGPAPMKHQ